MHLVEIGKDSQSDHKSTAVKVAVEKRNRFHIRRDHLRVQMLKRGVGESEEGELKGLVILLGLEGTMAVMCCIRISCRIESGGCEEGSLQALESGVQ